MSHFAQIDDNNIVINVIVAEQDFIDTGAVGDPSKWIQTSYNTRGGIHYGPDGNPDGGVALRLNFAGLGSVYHPDIDGFCHACDFPSWTLDETTGYYHPPIPAPEYPPPGDHDIGLASAWVWDEDNQNWYEAVV